LHSGHRWLFWGRMWICVCEYLVIWCDNTTVHEIIDCTVSRPIYASHLQAVRVEKQPLAQSARDYDRVGEGKGGGSIHTRSVTWTMDNTKIYTQPRVWTNRHKLLK
jgi:hypothetical protein